MMTLEDLWYGNINPHEQFLDGNEKLKAADQMEWVRRMNAVRAQATEIVNNELIYC